MFTFNPTRWISQLHWLHRSKRHRPVEPGLSQEEVRELNRMQIELAHELEKQRQKLLLLRLMV